MIYPFLAPWNQNLNTNFMQMLFCFLFQKINFVNIPQAHYHMCFIGGANVAPTSHVCRVISDCRKFWLESVRGRQHLQDMGLDGRTTKNRYSGIGMVGVNWIHPAQNRDLWQALVYSVELSGSMKDVVFLD